ncbi:AI-2E family transporter [Sphingomonas taxi]|uniref:AI-2E family transporter n=1 Tax=Sphingomonas taxi TaxID=1549858 RepID=UPI0009E022CD|nr:AI-2E family transporter [Sphingomonas taxi]
MTVGALRDTRRAERRPRLDLTLAHLALGVVAVGVTIVFLWSIWAFLGAILWSVVAAIMFWPLNNRILSRFPGRRNLAAFLTLLVVVTMGVVPGIALSMFLLDQAGAIYAQIQSGQIDIAATFERIQAVLPGWMAGLMRRTGITDLDSLREQLSIGITARLQILASHALKIGQSAASFLLSLAAMLYLTFFLLRDGRSMTTSIGNVVPLKPDERRVLADRFVTVVRATVKGGVLVGAAQGSVGGIIMAMLGVPNALLWAVVMALSSLLPAVGTGIVWVPVAIYLFATADMWHGLIMTASGILVIGSVDNVLRPILIGRETNIPDFVVLVTTLGGLAAFGFNGLLIGPVAAAIFMTVWSLIGSEGAAAVAERADDVPLIPMAGQDATSDDAANRLAARG